MRQSNDVDDAVNDVVMVIVHQQKRRVFLYNIHSEYFYLHFLLVLRAGYDRYFGDPACSPTVRKTVNPRGPLGLLL